MTHAGNGKLEKDMPIQPMQSGFEDVYLFLPGIPLCGLEVKLVAMGQVSHDDAAVFGLKSGNGILIVCSVHIFALGA
jgi:hypothetical protein